jgi:hypothetical protein
MADKSEDDAPPVPSGDGRRQSDRRSAPQAFDGPDRRKGDRRTGTDRRKTPRASGDDPGAEG